MIHFGELKSINGTKDRGAYFETTLKNWVASGRITPEKKDAIIEYIELAKNARELAGSSFGVFSPFFNKNKEKLKFTSNDKELWAELNLIGQQIDSEEEIITFEELSGEELMKFKELRDKYEHVLKSIAQCKVQEATVEELEEVCQEKVLEKIEV